MGLSFDISSLKKVTSLATVVVAVSNLFLGSLPLPRADAMGVIGAGAVRMHAVPRVRTAKLPRRAAGSSRYSSRYTMLSSLKKHGRAAKGGKAVKAKAKAKPVVAAKPIQPQLWADHLAVENLAPGVVHRFYRGPLNIHVIDIDMMRAPVKVQPSLAGNSFDRLKDVGDHARDTRAIAAVNANYFKSNGTPLGTLIIDGEWVAGPLYDRVSLGITRSGYVRIDRVNLSGTLTTSNEEVPRIWVNNVNQPRRTGCHLFAYTRRWGSFVRLPYQGALVAINAQGEVMDTSTKEMGIPWGGYVLADSKESPISKLNRGDSVQMCWHTRPSEWADVVEAVSGGPILIKNGDVFLDLKDEKFKHGWTGSHIHARTAAGVTNDNHLLLATIEGPHTLWDFAKFLHKLGAVDAMNLDGGGSTTMVVNGTTVTRNANAKQRRVASSIVVLDQRLLPQPENAPATPTAEQQLQQQMQMPQSEPQITAAQPQAMTEAPASAVEVQPTHESSADPIVQEESVSTSPAQIQILPAPKKKRFWQMMR